MKQVYQCDHCSYIGTEEEVQRHELIHVDIDGNPINIGNKIWDWRNCNAGIVKDFDDGDFWVVMEDDGRGRWVSATHNWTLCEPDLDDRVNAMLFQKATDLLFESKKSGSDKKEVLRMIYGMLYGRFVDRANKSAEIRRIKYNV